MEVATVVAGTAAVTAVHGTHKIFRFFFRPMRGDCKLTGALCLMYGHIILSDNLHHSSLRPFHISITLLNSNAVCQELVSMWISYCNFTVFK